MKSILSVIASKTNFVLDTIKKIIITITIFSGVIILINFLSTGQKIPLDIENKDQQKFVQSTINELEKDKSQEGIVKLLIFQGNLCNLMGLGCNAKYNNENTANNGLINSVAKFMSIPYENPPASAIGWTQQSLQNIGFIPKTHAYLGVGFSSLSGYMHIWKLFREISYVVLVLVMVSIGLFIIFGIKLNPQTEISIQNAIPRIIVAMLLITLSFAIAGFLIDLMYVILAIFVRLLFESGLKGNTNLSAESIVNSYMNANFGNLFPDGTNSIFALGANIYALLPGIIRDGVMVTGYSLTIFYTGQISKWIGDFLNHISSVAVLGTGWGNLGRLGHLVVELILFSIIFPFMPGLIIGAIIGLTILLFVFRVFFILISSYVKIILYTIFSPIILMLSAIPGVDTTGWWFKNLIGELIAFPVVAILLMTGRAIATVNNANLPGGSFGILTPIRLTAYPFAAEPLRLPFIDGLSSASVNSLIGLGIILLIPDFIKMIKGFIGVKDTGLNFGLGTFLAGAGVFTAGMGAMGTVESWKYSITGRAPMERQKGIIDYLPFYKRKQGNP